MTIDPNAGTTPPTPQNWQPKELRWLTKKGGAPVLQQKWQSIDVDVYGQPWKEEEWRVIPTTAEN